jgi:hypothetical protein
MMTAGLVKNKNVSRIDDIVIEYASPRSIIENYSVQTASK